MDGIITRDGRAYLQLKESCSGDIFELTEMYKSHLSKTGGRANKQAINYTQSLMLVSNGAKLLQITKSEFKSKAGGSFFGYFIQVFYQVSYCCCVAVYGKSWCARGYTSVHADTPGTSINCNSFAYLLQSGP